MKLVSLGGFGFWWVVDVVYIGSSPVYALDYRVAANLPHWAFVITSVVFFAIIGFSVVGFSTVGHIQRKRKGALLLQAEEEAAFRSRKTGPAAEALFAGAGAGAGGRNGNNLPPAKRPTPAYDLA